MMSHRTRRIWLLSIFTVLCFVGYTGTAHAILNEGPNQDDFGASTRYGDSYPGVDRTVDYTVATSATVTILTNTLNIYLPTSNGTIVVHDPNICYGTWRNGGRNYDQIDDGVGANWGYATDFTINGVTQSGYFDNAATCDNPVLTFNVSGASLDLNTNMYKYTMNVTANPAGDRYMNTYWITVPVGSYVSQDSSQPTSASLAASTARA